MTAEIGNFPALVGVGAYRPDRIVSNDELAADFVSNTSAAAIKRLTQIEQRRFPAPGEEPSDMAAIAVERTLESAQFVHNEETGLYEPLGGFFVSTVTKDRGRIMPDIAPETARKASLDPAVAPVDVGGACAGFLIALKAATAITQVYGEPTLVLGVGHLLSITNFEDRSSGIIFGSAAGGALVARADNVLQPTFYSYFESDPDAIFVEGTEDKPEPPHVAGKITMKGPLVADYAKRLMSKTAIGVAKKAGFYIYDEPEGRQENGERKGHIDWNKITLIPHQANGNLIDALAESLDAPEDKVCSNVAEDANTSAASIPLALDHAIKAGRFNRNERNILLLVAIGAGMVATACIIELKLP